MASRLAKVLLSTALLLSTHNVAQAEESPDIELAAEKAGVSPKLLAEAVAVTGYDPETYLCLVGALKCPEEPRGYRTEVRLTYYVLEGRTANGERVHLGGTACSTNWPMGTRFRFPNGEIVTCNDRGYLGNKGWLDVWGRPDLFRAYGPYVTVEVLDADT
jgi:hypothetical protein